MFSFTKLVIFYLGLVQLSMEVNKTGTNFYQLFVNQAQNNHFDEKISFDAPPRRTCLRILYCERVWKKD